MTDSEEFNQKLNQAQDIQIQDTAKAQQESSAGGFSYREYSQKFFPSKNTYSVPEPLNSQTPEATLKNAFSPTKTYDYRQDPQLVDILNKYKSSQSNDNSQVTSPNRVFSTPPNAGVSDEVNELIKKYASSNLNTAITTPVPQYEKPALNDYVFKTEKVNYDYNTSIPSYPNSNVSTFRDYARPLPRETTTNEPKFASLEFASPRANINFGTARSLQVFDFSNLKPPSSENTASNNYDIQNMEFKGTTSLPSEGPVEISSDRVRIGGVAPNQQSPRAFSRVSSPRPVESRLQTYSSQVVPDEGTYKSQTFEPFNNFSSNSSKLQNSNTVIGETVQISNKIDNILNKYLSEKGILKQSNSFVEPNGYKSSFLNRAQDTRSIVEPQFVQPTNEYIHEVYFNTEPDKDSRPGKSSSFISNEPVPIEKDRRTMSMNFSIPNNPFAKPKTEGGVVFNPLTKLLPDGSLDMNKPIENPYEEYVDPETNLKIYNLNVVTGSSKTPDNKLQKTPGQRTPAPVTPLQKTPDLYEIEKSPINNMYSPKPVDKAPAQLEESAVIPMTLKIKAELEESRKLSAKLRSTLSPDTVNDKSNSKNIIFSKKKEGPLTLSTLPDARGTEIPIQDIPKSPERLLFSSTKSENKTPDRNLELFFSNSVEKKFPELQSVQKPPQGSQSPDIEPSQREIPFKNDPYVDESNFDFENEKQALISAGITPRLGGFSPNERYERYSANIKPESTIWNIRVPYLVDFRRDPQEAINILQVTLDRATKVKVLKYCFERNPHINLKK